MTRPRGFAPWRPQRRTLPILDAVKDVLIQYVEYLPLTIRQVFYRLVGTEVIGKTEKDYSNLCELLNRARRAQLIHMEAIRDDGFTGGPSLAEGWDSPDEYLYAIAESAKDYRKDRQAGQTERLVLWCEAAGMVPQLARVAAPYGVPVKSSGGFDSVTSKHSAGALWGDGVPVTVLHVGDHDPSGECMFDALAEDVVTFGNHYDNDIGFHRIAVLPEHIRTFDLPTAPPKASTHQARKQMTETVQCEALSPDQLAEIVDNAIVSCLDLSIYDQVLQQEAQECMQLVTRLNDVLGGAA